jgi:hypothetical protein
LQQRVVQHNFFLTTAIDLESARESGGERDAGRNVRFLSLKLLQPFT